ncbi:alpha-hydroxy-acid oxidizing protein [Antarctobacter jejuensis]|uniref:alpha-hydroxy-acid oxidizing protein n=1 Tax=Antarctobacter jejuensis TaxID=1439938 RepID=UPI003FD50BF4
MTTLDGHPMAQNGQGGKALRVAHFASVSGDTFSDIVLFVCAPFLAISIEAFLGLPEKAALMILSLSFVAVVVGNDTWKGLLAACLGLFAASIATGTDTYPRLSMGSDVLATGLPTIAVVIGLLVVGEIFVSLQEMWLSKRDRQKPAEQPAPGDSTLSMGESRKLQPRSACPNIPFIATKPRWAYEMATGPALSFGNVVGHAKGVDDLASLLTWAAEMVDPALDWDDFEWIRKEWSGPVILKGIMDVENEKIAADLGIETIAVSRYGGRRQDGAGSSIALLPQIADGVGDRVELMLDSGVRTGMDVSRVD